MKRAGVVLLLVLLICSAGLADEIKAIKPAQDDKCPVCGMFVAKYPDFLAQITFKDGSYGLFDGVKDMMKYYLDMEKYNPSKKVEDIASIIVTDYYSLKPMDGRKAFYVVGSDVYGPMGHELIPFESEDDAKEFMVDHMGKSLLRFVEIKADLLKSLD